MACDDIICQPAQPVRPWKSGRVHLAEGSNVVVLELYRILRSSGGTAKSLRVGSENMENLMTVVDRLDELQALSVNNNNNNTTTYKAP